MNKLNFTWNYDYIIQNRLDESVIKNAEIKKLDNGRITEYQSPLDLVYDTGLKLEDVLLANKGKKKPIKSDSKYTVFDVKGNLIGFQYYK